MKRALVLAAATALLALAALLAAPAAQEDAVRAQRAHFVALKERLQYTLAAQERYRCCLKEPCTYCLAEQEEARAGEDAPLCACLDAVVEGRAPCGACVGEILEGEGNPLLAPYFADALADALGPRHRSLIARALAERYGAAVSTPALPPGRAGQKKP